MKKITAAIIALTLVLSLNVSAFAAGCGRGHCRRLADGDSIASCPAVGTSCSYVDEDADGFCDNSGGKCAFVDEDEDGVCDSYAAKPHHRGAGRGCRSRR